MEQGLALVCLPVFLVAMVAFWAISRRKGARPVSLREIDSFMSLPTTVGQAVENGQRLHISLGSGTIGDVSTASALAGLTVLQQISAAAVVSDKPPIVTTADGIAMLLAQDSLREVYIRQNAENRYDPNAARVAGVTPMAFGSAITSTIKDESVAGTVLIGSVGEEVILIAEAANRQKVTTLAASDNPAAQAFLYASTDHPLIGEDLFAGGAYIGRLPLHVASLLAQDAVRVLVILAILALAAIKLVAP